MKRLALMYIALFLFAAPAVPAAAGDEMAPGIVLLPPVMDEGGACYGGATGTCASGEPCWCRSAGAGHLPETQKDGSSGSAAGAPLETASTVASTKWQWRRANNWDYVLTALAAGGAAYLEMQDPDTPRWSSRNTVDEEVRDALRLDDRSTRRTVSDVSDAIMGIMIAAAPLDSFYSLGYRDRNWDALWQTSVVNLESFAFSSLVSVLIQTQTRRERPFVRNCVNGDCESDLKNRSMPSGHAAFSFTGAGLLCTHYQYQDIYAPSTERAICATGLGLASVDSVMRIMSDGHYFTDVLAGTAIGLFSGFFLPRLLHYWQPQPAAETADAQQRSRAPRKQFVVSPTVMPGRGAGLSCRYHF